MNYECETIEQIEIAPDSAEEILNIEIEPSDHREKDDDISYTMYSPVALAELRRIKWRQESGVRRPKR